MADTLPKLTATSEWQSANALSGLAVGTALKLEVLGGVAVDVNIGPAQPVTQDAIDRIDVYGWYAVAAGESEVWFRTCTNGSTTALVSVQANA